MNASFEEKSVWISLLGMLAIFGFYFYVAAQMLSAGVTAAAPYVPLFAGVVVLFVIVLVAGHVVVAIASRPEGRDERDRLISWKAEHNSSWLLATGVLAAIFGLALPIEPAWIANGLLMALVLSEVFAHILKIYYYRRGM